MFTSEICLILIPVFVLDLPLKLYVLQINDIPDLLLNQLLLSYFLTLSLFLSLHFSVFSCCMIMEIYAFEIAFVSASLIQLTGLTDGDKEALALLVKAGTIIDDTFHLQVVSLQDAGLF